MTAAFDDLVHQPVRLKVMAALAQRPRGESLEFTWLRDVLDLTDGNLSVHVQTLEQAGYLGVKKDFVGRRPRTRIFLTEAGRRAFDGHVAALQTILALRRR